MAWDGKSLAADRLVGEGYTLSKIWRLKDGSLFSGCGNYDDLVEVAEWLDHGAKPDKKPTIPDAESDFIIVDNKGRVYWLTQPYLRPIRFNEKIIALGSGGPYALGAMKAGADARSAVAIASECDPRTGKGITVMKPGLSPSRPLTRKDTCTGSGKVKLVAGPSRGKK